MFERFWQRWYCPLLLVLWVFIPEVRRLVDWQVGFNSISFINLIPLLAIVPLVPLCLRFKYGNISHEFRLAMCLWIVGFGYAFIVGWSAGGSLAAIYEGGQFVLPMLVGVWLATMSPSMAQPMFGRFASAALWLGALASVYGLYQYIAPPAWDVLWVNNSGLASIGKPEPFALRIFGPMNSPGVFASFLVVAIVLNLHRLRLKALWLVFPLLLCSAALALTFDRTAWLELALGIVVYAVCSPRRATAIGTVAAAAVLTFLLASNLSLITGDSASNDLLLNRLSTLNDVQNDGSAIARREETDNGLRFAFNDPLGQGLGTSGTATKLTSGTNTVIDNGLIARFVGMGVFGFGCYLAALAVGVVIAIRGLRDAYAARDVEAAVLVASSLAVQLMLIGSDSSGDSHNGLPGLMFWILLGMSSTLVSRLPERRSFPGLVQNPHGGLV